VRIVRLFLLLAAFAIPPAVVRAQGSEPSPPPTEHNGALSTSLGLSSKTTEKLQRVPAEIEKLGGQVEDAARRDDELARLRLTADALIAEALAAAAEVQPRLDAVKGQLEKLGPPPAKDAPPEAASVAAERARLGALIAAADGAVRTMELARVRGGQIVTRIQNLRQENFKSDLLRRSPSPLRPSVWVEIGHAFVNTASGISDVVQNWRERIGARSDLVTAVLLAGIATWVILKLAARWLIAARLHPPRSDTPSFFARAGAAVPVTLVAALPGVAGIGLVYGVLDSLSLLGLQMGLILEGLLTAVIIYGTVSGLATALFATERPCWRVFDVSDASAERLARLMRLTALLYAVDSMLQHLVSTLSLMLSVGVTTSLVASLALAGLIAAIVRTPFEPRSGEPVPMLAPRWLKVPLAVLAVFVVVATLLGYISLGRFISGQVLLTGCVLVLLFLCHLAIRAASTVRIETPLGVSLEGQLGLGETRRQQFSTLLAVVLHIGLALVGLPLLLLVWGFSPPDIADMLKALVFGFEIGQFRISLARIVIALGLFTAILVGTKLVQGWLRSRVLPTSNFDPGVSHSILTGLGYAGAGLATIVAISYTGLDVTNLAIVAGALSVGVGLGLQSIVNNFVSGLILLVERPIKVGDWIVLKDREGIVRRISVRSTEIETFDRASVIVPNSELVTASLLNWTHRNSVGRVTIRVGASYEADPEKVLAILREAADRHPDVLSHPAPIASFENFGASSLDFALRIFLADITQSLRIQTEVRVAIYKAFKEQGVEIPYNQSDVHLRDLDGLKTMVMQMLKLRQEARQKE
jgi:potassium efflux system protein